MLYNCLIVLNLLLMIYCFYKNNVTVTVIIPYHALADKHSFSQQTAAANIMYNMCMWLICAHVIIIHIEGCLLHVT